MNRFFPRWLCRYYTRFLLPYSENTLNERTRAWVSHHLKVCSHCRAEVDNLEAISTFFRANPPEPVPLKIDFWQRLEERIQAEAPRQPVARHPAFVSSSVYRQWGMFLSSFASTGAVMAAVVIVGLYFLSSNRDLSSTAPTKDTASESGQITIMVRPPKRGVQVAAKTLTLRKPTATPTVNRVPRTETKRVAVVKPVRPGELRRKSPGRIVRQEIVLRPKKQKTAPLPVATPEQRQVASAEPGTTEHYRLATYAHTRTESHEADARILPVLYRAGGAGESEALPAESTTETLLEMRRQQTLFSYGMN